MQFQRRAQAIKKYRARNIELLLRHNHAPENAGDIAEKHQQRQSHHQRNQTRHHQHGKWRQSQCGDCVDFLGDFHRAELRSDCRAGAARHQNRNNHRREFATNRRCDTIDDKNIGAIFLRLHAHQIRKHHAQQKNQCQRNRNRIDKN